MRSSRVRRAALCAADVPAADTFLRSWHRHVDPGGTGDAVDRLALAQGCVELARGHREALEPAEQLLARMDALPRDFRLFAVATAPHDLHRAGVAAQRAVEVLDPDPALAAVAAADFAADGDVVTAVAVLEHASGPGPGQDPVHRTLDLLVRHLQLPPARHAYWVRLARRVLPRPAVGHWILELGWLAVAAAAVLRFKALGLVVLRQIWTRYRPLPGLGRETSDLIRSYRSGGCPARPRSPGGSSSAPRPGHGSSPWHRPPQWFACRTPRRPPPTTTCRGCTSEARPLVRQGRSPVAIRWVHK